MTKRMRMAVMVGAALVLAVVAIFGVRAFVQHRTEQAFIAEQYAQLEQDKAALEETPAFDERAALGECENLWRASDDARRFWETRTVTAGASTQVSEDLHTVSGTVSGTNGQKDIEANFSCTVLLDDDEWIVELG